MAKQREATLAEAKLRSQRSEVETMAGHVWDRMLTFLGFEEEAPGEEPILPPPSTARDELARRRGHRRPAVSLEPARRSWEPPNPQHQVVVMAPKSFEAAQEAADHLKSGRPVLLNLDALEREAGQRLVNFLSGSVYALNGEMHRVGASVLLFAPQGVEVDLPPGLRAGFRE